MIIQCPQCGNLVSDKATICSSCGQVISKHSNESTLSKEINQVSPIEKEDSRINSIPYNPIGESWYNEPNQKNNSHNLIIQAIVLSLLMFGVGGFCIYKCFGEKDQVFIENEVTVIENNEAEMMTCSECASGPDFEEEVVDPVINEVTIHNNDGVNFENGWIDLELPSGTKWAACNVGANSPEEYGYYFGWSITTPIGQMTNNGPRYYLEYGDISNDIRFDAAKANLGDGWRMPTKQECQELIDECTWHKTKVNNVFGYKIVSKRNGNSIFLPAAGAFSSETIPLSYYKDLDTNSVAYRDILALYWTSTPDLNETEMIGAYCLCFKDDVKFCDESAYDTGLPIRAVCH